MCCKPSTTNFFSFPNTTLRHIYKYKTSVSPFRFSHSLPYLWMAKLFVIGYGIVLGLWMGLSPALAGESAFPEATHQNIPILGTTMNHQWERVGIVAEVEIQFEKRADQHAMQVHFATHPGRFSTTARQSVLQAISHAAAASGMKTNSWNITLTLPYPGVTLYGESLSAMVALSVLAFAKGDPLPHDRVLTGTITPDGHIGVVGGVPLKVAAASKEHLQRVLIPDEQDVADGDWHTPFLMQVSPVNSIHQAYLGLTDRPLLPTVTLSSSPSY